MKVKVVEIGILSPDWFSTLRLDENSEWETSLPSRLVGGRVYPVTAAGWRQISAEEFETEYGECVPLDMEGNIRMNPDRETYWVKEVER